MELTKTEVFECPKCESLSKNKEDVIKCLQRHRKEELKAEKERAFFDLQDKLNLILINNLKSFGQEEVKSLLVDAAKMVGYKLDLTISRQKIAADHYGKLCAIYSVDGSFKKVGASEFSGVKIPNFCNTYLRQLLDTKHSTYVGDLFRLIKGIEVYSGGGGSENFSYSLKLFVDQFPNLKEAYSEYSALDVAREAHAKRASSLIVEFNKNKLPQILHSDIPYQELKMQHEETYNKLKELEQQAAILCDRMGSRQKLLIEDYSKGHITPEPSYNYDAERLAELKERLF